MHVLYLHGFASSPLSSKARFLAERLGARGVAVQCPDLNAPDFSTLTTTRMIEQIESLLRGLSPGPVALIGSSLGAFVAWHVAARAEAGRADLGPVRLERLVLLAPAFDFGTGDMGGIGPDDMARWQQTGWRPFFHHAYGEERPVHYALYGDASRYRSALVQVRTPTLIVQGTRDEVVDPDMVVRVAAAHPNVILRLLDDGHQLLDHLETLWTETAAFLQV